MKINKFVISFFVIGFVVLFGAGSANAIEQSFIAPLVKESILLGLSEGKHTIIVGERGHILLNKNNENVVAADFMQVVSPTKTTLTNIFSRGDSAWAVGHDATILKSTDAGETWTLVQSDPDLDRPLLTVYFFDDDEGVAAGAYGLFYRSSDGGDTWVQERHPGMLSKDDNDYLDSIKDDEAFYLEELSFISPHLNKLSYSDDTLYVAGESGLVATSKDRGLTWQRLEIDYRGSFFDVGILPNEISLAIGLRGHMFLLTADENILIQTCLTTSLTTVFSSEGVVFVAGNNGVLLSVNAKLLSTEATAKTAGDTCTRHPSLKLLDTHFSDAILAGMVSKSSLVLVTAGGLKTVTIEE